MSKQAWVGGPAGLYWQGIYSASRPVVKNGERDAGLEVVSILWLAPTCWAGCTSPMWRVRALSTASPPGLCPTAFVRTGTVSSYAHVMADPCAAPPPALPPPPALGPKVEFTAGLPGVSMADFGVMQQAAFRAFVQQAAAGKQAP